MEVIKSQKIKLKTKRVFLKKGTCSRTFFYILNREYGHPLDEEESAIDLMAGGILQHGYQCGMLWGASMAVGAEAFRKFENPGRVTGISILATQHLMSSFQNRTKSIECEEITSYDLTKTSGLTKFFFSGKFVGCFKLAGKWAPEAIKAAREGLSLDPSGFRQEPLSCASVLIKEMGGNEEEMAMVSGFAGGLGLSGNGCGALAAAIWKNTMLWNKSQTGKKKALNPNGEHILKTFFDETDFEMECHKICGQHFNTIDEHSEYVNNGGCQKLINVLAISAAMI